MGMKLIRSFGTKPKGKCEVSIELTAEEEEKIYLAVLHRKQTDKATKALLEIAGVEEYSALSSILLDKFKKDYGFELRHALTESHEDFLLPDILAAYRGDTESLEVLQAIKQSEAAEDVRWLTSCRFALNEWKTLRIVAD